MIKVSSTVKMNFPRINQLTRAAVIALEQTAEALHTEVIQAEIVPRDMGYLQNEKMFVDYSDSKNGRAVIVHEGPYARRLYFHPEYNFQTHENAFASGRWFEPWERGGISADFAPKAYKKLYKKAGGV